MSPKIPIIRKNSYSIPLTFEDADGEPIDITGYIIFFTVKTLAGLSATDDTTATIKKDVSVHSDPTHGKSLIVLSTTDTDKPAGNYFYDVQIKTPSGAISSCERGELEILQNVTIRTTVTP